MQKSESRKYGFGSSFIPQQTVVYFCEGEASELPEAVPSLVNRVSQADHPLAILFCALQGFV